MPAATVGKSYDPTVTPLIANKENTSDFDPATRITLRSHNLYRLPYSNTADDGMRLGICSM